MDPSAAENLKGKGNAAFASKEYNTAIEHYTAAIELDPQNGVLFSNRAMSYLKLEDFHKALQDCDKGLALVSDPKATQKLYFRKASAFKGINSIKLARQYFSKVLEHDPSNMAAKQELDSLAEDDNMEDVKTHRVEIKIESVSKLPDEFQRLVDGRPSKPEKPVIKESTADISKEIEEMFDRPKKQYIPDTSAPSFVERSTTSILPSLKNIQGAQKDKAYSYVINLPSNVISDSFLYGVEPDFFSFYIEAASFVAQKDMIQDWDTKVLQTLTELSKLKRYQIAKSFCDEKDLHSLLELVQKKNPALLVKYQELI
ncbi:Serine/threonine-protein phosphatase 5 [Yamadazyma tenuis]|uniref:Serine/threonine-protein phosphatase 5 n=1 Tax=Candida tenuis TaxID=2315449 RepID=UPI00279A0B87|nr:Serine/threonine-protein phosphatase 5 [Yamadazyma tenuis]